MRLIAKIFTACGLPFAIQAIVKNLRRQKAFMRSHLAPILDVASKQNDGSLNENDFNKITAYYGLAVPAILGEAFCALHGREMTINERMASTSQGAMTGLFDDFFDKDMLTDEAIKNILDGKRTELKPSSEKLFDIFYEHALNHVPDRKQMQAALAQVYEAQNQSKRQAEISIPMPDIQAITFYKGGASLLFYRSAFLPVATPAEDRLLYGLGSLMQLANDIFDIYKDLQHGVKTLVTETSKVEDLRRLLRTELRIYYNMAYDIFPAKNAKQFLSLLTLGIFSRAFVCLDQLEKNESATHGTFEAKHYSRKQLVCDMDILPNQLRAAGYYIGIMSEIMKGLQS